MRPFIITILTLWTFSSTAQTKLLKIFKKTEYINDNIYRQTYDTLILTNPLIDIFFFKKNFYFPYYLPDKFIDEKYKNKKISVWSDQKGKKDYKLNWEHTYAYDKAGRLTDYTYSGCLVCSAFPYNYKVTYNKQGQVEQLKNTINEKDCFKIYYSDKGYIIKLEKYSMDKLETEILVVN
ncbi:MAG: hypothetical protein BGP13_23145 [Sphingobacteriales bacterium 40-81]|nr:MAG: hypothetical protein BGP13_23145 [Sphingobacteriales bacterium 40-81]